MFNGESGYLDHALATSSLTSQVTGVTDWHINPDEPIVLDYNVEFKTAEPGEHVLRPGPVPLVGPRPGRDRVADEPRPDRDLRRSHLRAGGFPFTIALTGATDADPGDAAGLQYAFDCGSGYGAFSTASTATCMTTTVGALAVGGKVRDDDGGVTEYRATVQVQVTFASLCSLVRQYADKEGVANALCSKLDAAAAKSDRKGQEADLHAFVNQVEAQSGKSLTAEEAAVLVALAGAL